MAEAIYMVAIKQEREEKAVTTSELPSTRPYFRAV